VGNPQCGLLDGGQNNKGKQRKHQQQTHQRRLAPSH